MKLIFTHENLAIVHHFKSLLESKDIQCKVTNENLASSPGGLSRQENWPKLWILAPEKLNDALQIIKSENINDESNKKYKTWKCSNCGEVLEEQFLICWKCGTSSSQNSIY